jgi:hypothetical protein
MSWSISTSGSDKEEVKARVKAELDVHASHYNGGPESKDVEAVRDRALALVDDIELSAGNPNVSVCASGYHSTIYGKVIHAEFRLMVRRIP